MCERKAPPKSRASPKWRPRPSTPSLPNLRNTKRLKDPPPFSREEFQLLSAHLQTRGLAAKARTRQVFFFPSYPPDAVLLQGSARIYDMLFAVAIFFFFFFTFFNVGSEQERKQHGVKARRPFHSETRDRHKLAGSGFARCDISLALASFS